MQTCPFCGQKYKIELTRIQGPWAFYECSKCLELSVVRGSAEFSLPQRPEAAVEPPKPAPLVEPPSLLPPLPPPAPPLLQAEPAPAPVEIQPKPPQFESPVAALARAIAEENERPIVRPVPGKLRAAAISGSSFVMGLACVGLLGAALLLPFTVPALRKVVLGEGPSISTATSAAPISEQSISTHQAQAVSRIPAQVQAQVPVSAPLSVPSSVAEQKPVDPPASSDHRRKGRVAKAKAILRDGPGQGFSKLALADENLRLAIMEEKENWLHVETLPGNSTTSPPLPQFAWIRKDLVVSLGPTEEKSGL